MTWEALLPLVLDNGGNIGVLIVGVVLILRSQAKTRTEITNNHSTHLRDDLDAKHQEVIEKLEAQEVVKQEIFSRLAVLERKTNVNIRELRLSISSLWRKFEDEEGR